LEAVVAERAAGAALGSIVRRDLARYYRLVGDYNVSVLNVDEADVVAHALREFDKAAYEYVWAAVDDFLESRDTVMKDLRAQPIHHRFRRADRDVLGAVLRGRCKDRGWSIALLDAVERYWSRLRAINLDPPTGWVGLPEWYDPEYPVSDAEIDALVNVGLVRPEAAERYCYERDDLARLEQDPSDQEGLMLKRRTPY
jgi:hypothetical protein